MKYYPDKIEKKWQKTWQEAGIYNATETSGKPKKYVLVEFPYPSGEGLHMGHVRPYVAADTLARYYRMNNFEVMFPYGWDAFGLPAENYAIKHGIQPAITTAQNIKNAKRQVNSWGVSFDWSREVNTTDPNYYKWTQWIFLQFFKAGLAYEATAPINWCPKDKTGLANEEVIDGKCDRCGTPVERRNLRQWFLRITAYAQKLIDGLKDLDWPEAIKLQQENWIGRSAGAEIDFGIATVFTTRPDTLFGATYLVLAPEHAFVQEHKDQIENWDEAAKYIEESRNKTDLQRSALEKEKTGVELQGIFAVNPATGQKIPVWIADYVLVTYGTGAIMAVPAHDERDKQFAEKFNLPIVQVVGEDGKLINSGEFNGLNFEEAKQKITAKFGRIKVQYKLRDWVFSRQRYWGEPIPIIHCEKCGIVPVPEDQLPVVLPEVKNYEPTGTGESPLAAIESWVNVSCPTCGGPAKRETNTMPQWAGSSWYYLRYTDPHNDSAFASMYKMKYWLPVDIYFGGMEHTTLHLLYSRFWHLFLHDQGLVPTAEPYARRQPHGIILAADGEKMSKSRGNVVNPDEIVKEHGADTLRIYELFLGPHEQAVSWNDQGIIGVRRFLERVWKFIGEMGDGAEDSEVVVTEINRLIKKVTEDLSGIKYNTAIASLMEFMNKIGGQSVSKLTAEKFLLLLAPFAPHISEELWHVLGHTETITMQAWPSFDPSKIISSTIEFAVQVNGKFRGNVEMPLDAEQSEVEEAAKQLPTVQNAIGSGEIVKVIFVKNKLINLVCK